jgi:hypothetical protein
VIGPRSHLARRSAFAAVIMLALVALVALAPREARAETVGMELTLQAAETLTLVPCSIKALPGQTVTGSLRDCVTGGDGRPGFGPLGTSSTPGGGTVSIGADGSYTYTAPMTPVADTIPFTAVDSTVDAPLHSSITVEVVSPLQAMSFTLRVAAGATVTGNLNDYVTGGLGILIFGPVGVDMRTRAGGTITIAPDGTFTYTAPQSGEVDQFAWFVSDESGIGPVESLASVVIVHEGVTPTPDLPDPSPAPTQTPRPVTPVPEEESRVERPVITELPSTGTGSEELLSRDTLTAGVILAIVLAMVFATRSTRPRT